MYWEINCWEPGLIRCTEIGTISSHSQVPLTSSYSTVVLCMPHGFWILIQSNTSLYCFPTLFWMYSWSTSHFYWLMFLRALSWFHLVSEGTGPYGEENLSGHSPSTRKWNTRRYTDSHASIRKWWVLLKLEVMELGEFWVPTALHFDQYLLAILDNMPISWEWMSHAKS